MMEEDGERFEDAVLLPLKMEEWVMSQCRRFLETGKDEEMDPSPRASRRMHLTNNWLLGPLTSRTEDKMYVLIQVCGGFYSINRKLTLQPS